jgi:hypothetical protein
LIKDVRTDFPHFFGFLQYAGRSHRQAASFARMAKGGTTTGSVKSLAKP